MVRDIVTVNNLSIHYKSTVAVQNLSFSIKEREIYAIIGPNGAGKTSTVECIEGLRMPTSGEVSALGVTPHLDRKKLYKQMGIQLQEADYPDKMKVKELCIYFSSLYEHPANWQPLLKQLDLQKRENTLIKKLSGGEKRKLSILLALLPKPKLLILDELTTGLDPEARRMMWQSLLNIRHAGTTILLVSHYLDEVEYLADRLLYLVDGHKQFEGTLEEFRQFAENQIAPSERKQNLNLEQLYLLISPKKGDLLLEGMK